MNFFEYGAQERVGRENQLLKLNGLIKWEKIRGELKGFYKNEVQSQGGQEGYDVLKMFKAVLLGQWHSLSDPKLEESLRVRLDFMLFCEFEMTDELPDETTLCRFRNKLVKLGLAEKLLAMVNGQLEESGLKVEKARGAIVDATVIESAARPRQVIEEEVAHDRKEATEQASFRVEESADADARWLKKGKRCYFGYKSFVRADAHDGFIEKVEVTPANKSEVQQLASIVAGTKSGRRLFADKGYASADNRQKLRAAQLKDGIMHKASRGKPLTRWQKKFNRLVSHQRFRIEQAFGTLKRRFQFYRASYIGQAKVLGQMLLKAICFNLLKAVNKIALPA